MFVDGLGIGKSETQLPVQLRGGVAWCDLRIGCQVFEFDGKIKVLGPDRGGVATRRAEDVLWDERGRELDVCAEGLGMSRVRWHDLFGPAREALRQRLLKEYAVTTNRFGEVLPSPLAESAARLRAERAARRTRRYSA